MSSLAQEESRSISENVRWGQRKKAADGKYTLPFERFLGYDKGPDGSPVINEIKHAFAEHMMKHRGYSEEEAEVAVHDFPDPYSNPYLREEFIDTVEVDGIEYEIS